MPALGDAYVDVHANTKPFAKELGTQMKAILTVVQKDLDAHAERVGRDMGIHLQKGLNREGYAAGARFGDEVGRGLRPKLSLISNEFRKVFTRYERGNFLPTRIIGGALLRFGGALRKLGSIGLDVGKVLFTTFKLIGTLTEGAVAGVKALFGVTQDFSKVGSSIAAAGAEVVGSLAALVAEAPAAIIAVVAMVAAFGAFAVVLATVAGVIILVSSVFAALLGFLVLVPAAITTIAAVVIPLVIVFHNLSDAMDLVFEKDPEKLKKGLEKLSPTLQGLVGVLRGFTPALNKLANDVQAAFFGPIVKQLGPALKALLPILDVGFSKIAAVAGQFVARILDLVRSPEAQRFFGDLLGNLAYALSTLIGPVIELLKAFGATAQAFLPAINALIIDFGAFLVQFAAWVQGAVSDGRFQKFLDDAVASLRAIWGLTKALIALFSEMFSQTNRDGREFFAILQAGIEYFTAWLKSPNGKEGMQALVALAKLFAVSFNGALVIVTKILDVLGKAYKIYQKIQGTYSSPPASASTNLNDLGDQSYFHGYDNGGIIRQPEIAQLHANEVVVPLSDPNRARELATQSGLMDMLNTGTTVIVQIGSETLQAIAYKVSTSVNRAQSRSLSNVPRTA